MAPELAIHNREGVFLQKTRAGLFLRAVPFCWWPPMSSPIACGHGAASMAPATTASDKDDVQQVCNQPTWVPRMQDPEKKKKATHTT
jgi:hypothetical protein